MPPRTVGIDLAGVPTRATGVCVLGPRLATRTSILGNDASIVRAVEAARPDIVAVDAPLGLPRGRCCLRDDCSCRGKAHFRACDRALLDMGIRFLPITLGAMRPLTERGMWLRHRLEADGWRVVEVYPGAVQDLMGLPRKGDGVERLRRALVRQGIRGDIHRRDLTHDELDAVTCALMGRLHLDGHGVEIGDPEEMTMVIPRPPKD